MDVIFAVAHLEGVSPVAVSLRKDLPLAGSAEGDRILGYKPGVNSSEGSLERSSNETADRGESLNTLPEPLSTGY